MVNKVTLLGRLGADPEVRKLENGSTVARIRLATSEYYKDKEGNLQELTEWHSIILWRYLAENAEKNLKKGSLVYVEGKLTTRKWQDKDGNERYTTEVNASVMRNLERKSEGGNNFPTTKDDPYARTQNNNANQYNTPVQEPPQMDDIEDDLPF